MRFADWFRFPTQERERLRRALRAGSRTARPLPPDYPRFGSLYKLLWLVQSGERHLRHTLTSRGRRQHPGQPDEGASNDSGSNPRNSWTRNVIALMR